MRAARVVSLLVLLCPAAAPAQTPPAAENTPPPAATAPAPKRGGDITRDDYVERAKHAAERRFDRMDADHNGVLTVEERRTYRVAHSRTHAPKPP